MVLLQSCQNAQKSKEKQNNWQKNGERSKLRKDMKTERTFYIYPLNRQPEIRIIYTFMGAKITVQPPVPIQSDFAQVD